MRRIRGVCRLTENRTICSLLRLDLGKDSCQEYRERHHVIHVVSSAEVKLSSAHIESEYWRSFMWLQSASRLIFHNAHDKWDVLAAVIICVSLRERVSLGVACCGCEQWTKSQEVGTARSQLHGCVCLDPHVIAGLVSISSPGFFRQSVVLIALFNSHVTRAYGEPHALFSFTDMDTAVPSGHHSVCWPTADICCPLTTTVWLTGQMLLLQSEAFG